MNSDFFVSWQFGVTLLIVLALGVWQLMRVRRAKQAGEHSVMTSPHKGPDERAGHG